jgi:hypothetical protein
MEVTPMAEAHWPPMSDEEIASFIEAHDWRFAKTMPKTPHWYVVKSECHDIEMYHRFAHHIDTRGYKQRFFSKRYTYFDFGDFQYWICADGHWSEDATAILNRAKRELPEKRRLKFRRGA